MARTTLSTRVASLEADVASLKSDTAQILAILQGQQAPAVQAVVVAEAPAKSPKWEAICEAKAARAAKDVRCALNSKERKALAAKHQKALTAARKVSREAYDAKWLALVTAAAKAK